MAQLTRDDIVSEGQLLAGRDDLATQAAAWLQRWLDSVAASWPWPVLQAEAVGVPLANGASSLVIGNGSGTVTQKIMKILDNVWLYDSTRTFRRRIRIRHQLTQPSDRIAPTTQFGPPATARVFTSTFGTWTLYFEPACDKDYLLTIPYLVLPAPMTLGTNVPWYFNDETMVQAVAFKVAEYHHGKDSPITQAFQQSLAGLVANDRIRYGASVGVNDSLALDPAVFRPRR